ncbi:MAG: 50S ribosome-binding GTPase, partial [Burkholderiaceae bacterium]|nr:50S ribosome-binding GTPase [Burkholderiaceae bacterium]
MNASAIALVGHPNVGKSVLFHRLTGAYVNVSNYPGTTVEIARAATSFDTGVDLIDTPGVLTLPARSEDERVTMRALLQEPLHTVIQVGDAKNLRRTLSLTALLAELGVPSLLALNMQDEARLRSVVVNTQALSIALGIPVVATVATSGEGIEPLTKRLTDARILQPLLRYNATAEAVTADLADRIAAHVRSVRLSARGLALLYLGQDCEVTAWLQGAAGAAYSELEAARWAAQAQGVTPAALAHERSQAVVSTCAEPTAQSSPRPSQLVGQCVIHRVWAWPILLGVLFAVYQ